MVWNICEPLFLIHSILQPFWTMLAYRNVLFPRSQHFNCPPLNKSKLMKHEMSLNSYTCKVSISRSALWQQRSYCITNIVLKMTHFCSDIAVRSFHSHLEHWVMSDRCTAGHLSDKQIAKACVEYKVRLVNTRIKEYTTSLDLSQDRHWLKKKEFAMFPLLFLSVNCVEFCFCNVLCLFWISSPPLLWANYLSASYLSYSESSVIVFYGACFSNTDVI